MIWIGVDPGLRSGAIGAIDHDGRYVAVHDIAADGDKIDARALKQLILEMTVPGDDYAICVEQVWTMPKQGIASTGKFMRAYGAIGAVCELLCDRVVYVTPQVWKREMKVTSDKDQSLVAARLMFPQATLLLKKDHGKAEALLIAEYARSTLA
jgi:Holliday junction resolvasome RuvABC endonuclease subunit